MNKKLSILLCLTLLILSGCRASGNTIRFGAADIGGMYYSFANTFTELANEEYENYEFEVRATAGSSANLRLLSDNYIELGIAQADLLDNAYKKNSNLRAIAGLYTEACQLVVKADSDIKSINDLSGHTVSIGAEESGTELNANQILEFSGMPSSIVTTKNMDYIDAANSLKSGDIDAFFCTAGLKTTIIDELSKEYLINPTTLKDTFKGIFGQPIGSYMKEYRIRQAAILLRQTQSTIAEIANKVGYENQSKFATAFRDVLKITPAEYRKQNSGE